MPNSVTVKRPITRNGVCTEPGTIHSAHRNVKELAADITAWADAWNDNPTPFVWHKTANEILERLAGYCTAITGTEYDSAST